MTDTFDAVLAEMRERASRMLYVGPHKIIAALDRLAAAHAAEVAEIARLSEKRRLALIAMTEDRTLQRTRAEAAEARVRELEAHAADRESEIETLKFERQKAEDEAEAAERDARAKQARIDELMLEYCPDEMPPEQVAEWKRHQAIATTEQAPERAGRE